MTRASGKERAAAGGAVALALAAALGARRGPPAPPQDAAEDEQPIHAFALPLTQRTRTGAEDAREHLSAGRLDAALTELQGLLEEGRGDVLPPAWRAHPELTSQFPAYPGAAAWARRTLRELPPAGRDLYRRRFEDAARAALDEARARGGARGLMAVARTWPLTRAAELAWWSLGDLELERGHPEDAVLAWERARELAALFGPELPSSAAARLDLARSLSGATPDAAEPGSRPARGAIPALDADTWSLELDLSPFEGGRSLPGFSYCLHPLFSGDRVLVNTTLRLYAVDAYAGRLLWSAGPPAGWERIADSDEYDDYFEVLAAEDLVIRPAARSGVVVAAMQVPFTAARNDDYMEHPISRRIPERRLHAFDIATGTALWSHDPRLLWVPRGRKGEFALDPDDGRYAARMNVAGSPVISGARVLVPCYRLTGRIDYHVACYELATGELVWSTPVISGQREINMFGNHLEEFVAAPLTVAGDLVIAQTELGAVAALDLLTGEIRWVAEYDQIPIPANPGRSYAGRGRGPVWQVAPPVVAGDTVIAAPNDSQDLVAFDLVDGRVLWGLASSELLPDAGRAGSGLDLLLGVERDTVYLAGFRLAALQRAGGLRTRAPFQPRWTVEVSERRATSLEPLAVLAGESIVVPVRDERLVVDRGTGEIRDSLSGPWSAAQAGNVAVGDGVLFTLGRRHLNGFFDWEVMLDRQRAILAAHPGDPGVAASTATLFVRRARALHAAGDSLRARDVLQEAEDLLAPLVATAGGTAAPPVERARLAAMHELRFLQADVFLALADPTAARRAIAAARPYADTPSRLRDTLLKEEELLRDGPPLPRLAVLAELEERCGELPIPDEVRAGSAGWLIGEAIRRDDELAGWQDARIDVALWVLLTRADLLARGQDGAGALRDLHAALARFGGVGLNDAWRVAGIVEERIARRLELDGRTAYEPFERAAAELLAAATAADDPARIAEVGRLYPHAAAARAANRALLQRALRAGDPSGIARMLYGPAPGPGLTREERELGLLALAVALARAGNHEFLAGFAADRAAALPDLGRGLDEGTRAELDSLLAAAGAGPPPSPAPDRFTHDVGYVPQGRYSGSLERVASLARAGPGGEVERLDVYLEGGEGLLAFSSAAPTSLAWSFETPSGAKPETCAAAGGRLFVGSRDLLLALDAAGEELWAQAVGRDEVLAVRTGGGVVVIETGVVNRPARAAAFDGRSGVPLWDFPIPPSTAVAWRAPILGGGAAVFPIHPHVGRTRAVVVGLYGGEERLELDLDHVITARLEDNAWIEGGELVVPSYGRRGEQAPSLAVYDLAAGKREWLVSFEEGEEFHSIAVHDGRSYLVTRTAEIGLQRRGGGVYELDVPLRSRRRVVALDPGDEVIGLAEGRRTALPTPHLFVRPTSHAGNTMPIRALHLPNGRCWVYHLPVGDDELYHGQPMSLPAVSTDCVAFAYVLRDPRTRLPQRAMLEFVDLAGGFRLDSRVLVPRLNGGEGFELRGLGDALFVLRREGSRLTRGLDVLGSSPGGER
ncbi:MAG: PQQ-binding-like beta-propeller repeat protein [Planctomycetota bacterium]